MLSASGNLKNALVACAILFMTTSLAHSDTADVIKTRQQGLKDMGASLKLVRDQLRQPAPDMAAIKAAGDNIKKTADMIAHWFPKGSGIESGIKTGAKPEIWSDPATFEKKRLDLVAAAGPFAELTASGDKEKISKAVRPLSGTCKGCHDLFFNDEH
jgi:cytochrome c556